MPPDYTQYTDAQLDVAARFSVVAQAELDRRRAQELEDGTNDGSRDRVRAFIAENRGRKIRKR